MKDINEMLCLNEDELEMVSGGGIIDIGSDPAFWGSVGNLIVAYISMNEKNMPQNKVLNICCIYKQRLEAMASGDKVNMAVTYAKLKFLGVDVDALDNMVKNAKTAPAA